MDDSRRATRYDLFKLIVAILLLILFLLLLRRPTPQPFVPAPTAISPTAIVSSNLSATASMDSTTIRTITPSVSHTPTEQQIEPPTITKKVSTTNTTSPVSPTEAGSSGVESTSSLTATEESIYTDSPSTATATAPAAPTETLSSAIETTPAGTPSPTVTLEAIPTETVHPATGTNIPTPTASPTETPAPESTSTPTPVVETPSPITACEVATGRSRLQTGNNATILRRLNFRSSPGIKDNWLRTNLPGSNVEVIGGPECLPHSFGAYLWWQIRLPSGEIGWSAEGSIHGTFYFMEPAE